MVTPRALVPALVAALALAAAGCKDSKPAPVDLPKSVGVDRSPVLTQFASCGALEQAIEDALVLRMRAIVEQNRVAGPWGYPFPVAGDGGPVAAPGAGAGPTSHSTTNAQVDGVLEADFVQNDGTRIAALAGGKLYLARSWPPASLARTAALPLEGWPHDLFLAGDRAVVFSAVYVPRAIEGNTPACPIGITGLPAGDLHCGYWADNVVKVTTVDVSDLAAPRVTAEVYLPGSYVSARRIGDRVRLVLRDELPFPEAVRFWPALPPGASDAERDAAFAALEAANEALIRGRTLEDWLRTTTVKRPGAPDVEVGHACGDFAGSSGPVRPGILTVATLDVPTAALVSRTSVFAEAGTVYASAETLYVAAQHWWWWPEPGQRDATYLHAFGLTDPDRATYLGSGVVDGWIRDQYGMDEHGGVLRVASTVSTRVDDGTPWGRVHTAGRITTLAPRAEALEVLGETPAFGPDERIFGTRFLGDRGFVITARQIDPLFTFDLSDPAHPQVVGELEMPGFISYLHPISDTHLLGVGMETAAGGPARVKVALLDVADLAHPVDVSTVLVGEGFSYSDALWDPHAFTWLPDRKLVAIPFADWSSPVLVSDLRVFSVDPATGVVPVGALSMADVYLSESGPGWSWVWSPYVRRGVLASDPSGDYVYAVSDAGVRVARLADLPAWIATAPFEAAVLP